MQYRPDFRGMGVFLMSSDARRVCTQAAAAGMARARALVAPDSPETAASGRLLHGIGGRKNDRVRVTVAFGVDAVPLQFGSRAVRPTRFLTRAFD